MANPMMVTPPNLWFTQEPKCFISPRHQNIGMIKGRRQNGNIHRVRQTQGARPVHSESVRFRSKVNPIRQGF
jgi:hypothetical protein